jgi:hypothetical protein
MRAKVARQKPLVLVRETAIGQIVGRKHGETA